MVWLYVGLERVSDTSDPAQVRCDVEAIDLWNPSRPSFLKLSLFCRDVSLVGTSKVRDGRRNKKMIARQGQELLMRER